MLHTYRWLAAALAPLSLLIGCGNEAGVSPAAATAPAPIESTDTAPAVEPVWTQLKVESPNWGSVAVDAPEGTTITTLEDAPGKPMLIELKPGNGEFVARLTLLSKVGFAPGIGNDAWPKSQLGHWCEKNQPGAQTPEPVMIDEGEVHGFYATLQDPDAADEYSHAMNGFFRCGGVVVMYGALHSSPEKAEDVILKILKSARLSPAL